MLNFEARNVMKKMLTENGIEIIAMLPLYYLLNRPIFGKIHHFGINIDNLLAPIYYYLDSFLLSYRRNNLNLIIAKKVKP